MTSSILFQPIDTEVYQLTKETGPEYYGTLIAPYVRSSTRRVVVIGSGKEGLPVILNAANQGSSKETP